MNLKLAYEPEHPSSQSSYRCLQNEVTRSMPIPPYNGMPSYHKGHCKCYPGVPRKLHPSPYLFEVSKKVLWHPFKHLGGGRHLGDLSPELFCNICIE